MDPLSITLAVITLTTALKDIVELAQQINDSLQKVPNNFQQAHSLAAETLQTVLQLNDFCNTRSEVLCNSSETGRALRELVKEMHHVHVECLKLVPAAPERKFTKLKSSLKALINRDKIEDDIRNLRDRVNKCYSTFMMFSIIRIETRLIAVSKRKSTDLNKARKEITDRQVSNDQLIAFNGKRTSFLSKIPSDIEAEVISDMYLRLQINAIDKSLKQLADDRYFPVEDPLYEYTLPFRPPIAFSTIPRNKTAIQNQTISRTLEIQNILQRDSNSLSIQAGAWEMVNLSVSLHELAMYEEAATVGLWTVSLYRTLVEISPAVYSPYLVHTLQLLSEFYKNTDNLDGAQSAIIEAVDITCGLQTESSGPELRVQHGSSLTTKASVLGLKNLPEESLQAAQEAVQIFEGMFEGEVPPLVKNNGLFIRSSNVEWHELLVNFSDKALVDYARALHQFSHSLQAVGRLEDAAYAEMKAVEMFFFVCNLYPETSLQLTLNDFLVRLSEQVFRQTIPATEALGWVELAEASYREYCEIDPKTKTHGAGLFSALWEKANILGELERYDEATEAWKEAANLARDIMADQMSYAKSLYQVCRNLRLLKRHDEAVEHRMISLETFQSVFKTPSEEEAKGYYDLAVDLELAGRYCQAIDAAQDAVTHYRTLAFSNPGKYKPWIAQALNNLTNILVNALEYDQAFIKGFEAMKMYETLILEDESIISEYLRCLQINSSVAHLSGDMDKAMECGANVINHSRKLAERFQHVSSHVSSALTNAISSHARVCFAHDRLPEAIRWIKQALAMFEKDIPDKPSDVEAYLGSLIDYASFLDRQGDTELALKPVEEAYDFGQKFLTNPAVASLTAAARYRWTHLLCALGRYPEGLQISDGCIAFVRQTTLAYIDVTVGTLQASTLALWMNGKTKESHADIQEAVELCRSDRMLESTKINKNHLALLPSCLQMLSDVLADLGQGSSALKIGHDAVDECLKLKDVYGLPWLSVEETYFYYQHSLSIRLAAATNDNIAQALEIMAQVKMFYKRRSQVLNRLFTIYACVLRTLAIFHCAAGQHEQGAAVRAELNELLNFLDSIFPGIARMAKNDLDFERQRPCWIALLDKFGLRCNHQDGI